MARSKSSWLWFIVIAIAGIYLVMSCTDSERFGLGDTQITTPTDSLGNPVPACADLPQNDPRVRAGDCISSQDILDADRDIDNPILFGLALVTLIVGILGVTGTLGKLLNRAENGAALLLTQDSLSGPIPMTEGRDSWYLLAGVVAVVAIVVIVWLVKRKKSP